MFTVELIEKRTINYQDEPYPTLIEKKHTYHYDEPKEAYEQFVIFATEKIYYVTEPVANERISRIEMNLRMFEGYTCNTVILEEHVTNQGFTKKFINEYPFHDLNFD